ncbi:MAG: type II toxin-antitoxin system RelE/ParE family toxin [Verrucomicrobia bacterium]|nr:type II toxin-antitoxin system RelE/ParE family toxin [Verrucomicrobiota bacterium]
MLALEKHPLVNADLREAFDWYEDQRAGLGGEFKDDFLTHLRQLPRDAPLYAVRFADVRRLNLDRFPYGLFYVIRPPEIWLLAVLHASRDSETVLAARRQCFHG